VNVTNKHPTVCINDLLHLQSLNDDPDSRSHQQPEPLTVEELIARSLSVLEDLIDKFEKEDERQLILDQYYKHWLHRRVAGVVLALVGAAAVLIHRLAVTLLFSINQ